MLIWKILYSDNSVTDSSPASPRCKAETDAQWGRGEETRVSKMLMLFLITAVLLEMAHDINHLLLLSSHYGWSTMLLSARVGGGAVELWEWFGSTIGVLKAHVPLLYISASFITVPLCAPHTCKAAFWWREGQRGKRMPGRKMSGGSRGQLEEGSGMKRLFLLIFIYSENVGWVNMRFSTASCFVFTFAPTYTW